MDKTIQMLTKRYRTNCPFYIAKQLNINVWFDDLGDSTRGFYFRKLRRRYICIHNGLSEFWARFVCAHEIGHDRLHPGISRFWLDQHTLFNPGKFERQANRFAVKLLTSLDTPEHGESLEHFLIRNGVPVEMIQYYE